MQNNRQVGTAYEEKVTGWLTQHGYRILERNFRCKLGEIDIIAQRGRIISFVEVKYRKSDSCGIPAEAVDHRKQVRISNVASYFLYIRHYPYDMPCLFDVASVTPDGIEYIENAFSYCGNFAR
ncbi:MAG: YraN family protein [Clostridiales bacterium]|nr:YraN family protein [Clostridiales bacterium]